MGTPVGANGPMGTPVGTNEHIWLVHLPEQMIAFNDSDTLFAHKFGAW